MAEEHVLLSSDRYKRLLEQATTNSNKMPSQLDGTEETIDDRQGNHSDDESFDLDAPSDSEPQHTQGPSGPPPGIPADDILIRRQVKGEPEPPTSKKRRGSMKDRPLPKKKTLTTVNSTNHGSTSRPSSKKKTPSTNKGIVKNKSKKTNSLHPMIHKWIFLNKPK